VTIQIAHNVERPDLGLGLVRAEGLAAGPTPTKLAEALDSLIARRAGAPLDEAEETRRKGSRDILRNGVYKPTGRGKPASEYLLRAAREESFPRISGPVDANNLVSLEHCVPISLWDLDLAATARFEVRLGGAEERYVFNPSGQELQLRDLVCGCGLHEDTPVSRPLVTPIKDGLATKLTEATTRVAGCIYYPLQAGSVEHLRQITADFARWLEACGEGAEAATAVLEPGGSTTL
jgi:DNA/RNA-binding domain of Phe-tRNA-synthetase-like protein